MGQQKCTSDAFSLPDSLCAQLLLDFKAAENDISKLTLRHHFISKQDTLQLCASYLHTEQNLPKKTDAAGHGHPRFPFAV